jgi:Ca2+-binding RTX toxin-like protein
VEVDVILHGLTSTAGLTYRKYGPLTPGADPVWYTLSDVVPGAAQFSIRMIAGKPTVVARLKLRDGGVGDSTGVDGLIVDPGAVAVIPETAGVRLQGGVLNVVGTARNDTVKVTRTGNRLQVFASFVPGSHTRNFALTSVKQIHVSLGDGNDQATIAPQIRVPAILDGGDGNDVLRAGSGRSVLLGGAGADALFGGIGRSLAIGGAGRDRLTGGAGDSILAGGTTAFDAHTEALLSIVKEWDSKRPVATRTRNLRDGGGSASRVNGAFFLQTQGASATVVDDGERDQLFDGKGQDWFLTNGPLDKITR